MAVYTADFTCMPFESISFFHSDHFYSKQATTQWRASYKHATGEPEAATHGMMKMTYNLENTVLQPGIKGHFYMCSKVGVGKAF